jgi:hypothetical protein
MSTISNKKKFLLLTSSSSSSDWSSLNTGANNRVLSIVSSDTSNDIYAGGLFTSIGGTSANRVAKWNGTSWTALGNGIGTTNVSEMAIIGNDLYVGGSFTTTGDNLTVNNIAKWNGTSWSALGSGLNGSVTSMAVNGNELYVGGFFTLANGNSANRVAKWDGSSWSALTDSVTGINGTSGQILTMTFDLSGNLWVGGNFPQAGGKSALFIARWDGSNWFGFNVNTFNQVPTCMTVDNSNNLYVGGYFTQVLNPDFSSFTANYLAKYSGSTWSPITVNGINGVGDVIENIFFKDNKLYVVGQFLTAGNISTNCIAMYDGSTWNNLKSLFTQGLGTILVKANIIYVGGSSTSPFNYISKYSEQISTNTFYLPLSKGVRRG